MNEFISIDKLIRQAKIRGVNFGSGDPYNRLRYYTKIGWLPHMIRRIDRHGDITGHYPTWSVDRLVLIEELKSQGYSNEEISLRLKTKNTVQDVIGALTSPEIRKQLVSYVILFFVGIILLNELGVIHLGKQKTQIGPISDTSQQLQITQSGTSFVPKDQTSVFIAATKITSSSKVYITFTHNYSPATRYWISQTKGGEGFLLTLDAPVFDNTEFNWWLTQ